MHDTASPKGGSKTHDSLPLWEPTTRQLPPNTHAGHQFPSKSHSPPTHAPKPRIPSGKKCDICRDVEVLVARIWPFRAISKTLHNKKTSQTDRNRTKLFSRVACMYADVFRPKTFLRTPQKTIGVTYAIAPKNVKSNQPTERFFRFSKIHNSTQIAQNLILKKACASGSCPLAHAFFRI